MDAILPGAQAVISNIVEEEPLAEELGRGSRLSAMLVNSSLCWSQTLWNSLGDNLCLCHDKERTNPANPNRFQT